MEIDSQINKNFYSTNFNNHYNLLITYEKEITELARKIDIEFKEGELFLQRFNLKFNNQIKNEKEYLSSLVCSFIIKNYITSDWDRVLSETKKEINFLWESDRIINSIFENWYNFIIWLEICYNVNIINKVNFKIDNKSLRLDILKITEQLIEQGAMRKKKKWVNNKSYVFLILEITIKEVFFINIYINKFNIYIKDNSKIYIYIDHFSNVFEFIKTNSYSNIGIEINLNSNFTKNLFEIKALIDYELLSNFFLYKIEKTDYDEKDLFDYKKTYIEELKLSILRDRADLTKIYSQKLAEIDNLLRIKAILKISYKGYFYFPVSLCFRGRTYYSSSVSFTSYKEFRHCLHEGIYENLEPPFHPLKNRIEKILNPLLKELTRIRDWDFSNKKESVKNAVIWVLISIAELYKKEMGKTVKISDFIDCGIGILNKDIILTNMDEYDKLKLDCCKKILKEINEDVYIKRYLSKDATASCFQHLIKILGNAEQSSLKWCNLDSEDTWYDTYSYILQKWQIENKNQYSTLFTRSNIKKPTMTIQYGATFNTCWGYFLEKTEISGLTKENLGELKKSFKNFFNFINSTVGILDKNSKEILTAVQKLNYLIVLNDKTKINLVYYKMKKKQIKFQKNKKRYTKNQNFITDEVHKKKIKTSLRANYIHVHDSAVIRHVINIRPILTIHDCFLIDYLSTTYLISIVNEAMQAEFHDLKLNEKFKTENIFSLFIVI